MSSTLEVSVTLTLRVVGRYMEIIGITPHSLVVEPSKLLFL